MEEQKRCRDRETDKLFRVTLYVCWQAPDDNTLSPKLIHS